MAGAGALTSPVARDVLKNLDSPVQTTSSRPQHHVLPVVQTGLGWVSVPSRGDSSALSQSLVCLAALGSGRQSRRPEMDARLHKHAKMLTDDQRCQLIFDMRDFMELAEIYSHGYIQFH